MEPASLIPLADAMPGPAWWFEILLLLTFVLHLLLMNTVLGGTVIVAVHALRKPASEQGPVRDFATRLPTALALAINLGVPPLLFVQVLYGNFFYTSSVIMALWWLGIVGLVMLAYYGLYIFAINHDELGTRRIAVIVLALLLLVATSFVFSNNMTLMLQPERWLAWFERRDGALLNLGDPTLIPRWLHMLVGSIAIGGLALSLFHVRRASWGAPDAAEGIETGLRWFSHATYAQIALGIWFLMALPRDLMLRFMGGDTLATAAFILGLIGTALALLAARARSVALAVGAAVGTVTVMAVMRTSLREGYLAPWAQPQPVNFVETSPLVLFLASAVCGVAAIIWMLRLMRSSRKGA